MSNREKSLYGIFLLLLWAVFAWFGKTEASGLISAIEAILAGLGLYHFNNRQPAQAPPPALPTTSTPSASPTPPPAPPAS